MESSNVICITNGEDNIDHREGNKSFNFSFPSIISCLREKKIHCVTSYFSDNQMKNEHETKQIIHSIKVGISLVLVSLLYLVDPLYEQVGENAMWAIMTVVVIFEFSAGATLGKGLNRGMGTILGAGLGCLAAVLAQNLGAVGNKVIIGASVFIFGTIGTYFRLIPSIKKRYDYGVMLFILTYNLVVVSGVRADQKVWEIACERFLTILMGFIICICVSLLLFPLWASDELHQSTVSRFQDLANTIQGCLEEYINIGIKEENKSVASFGVCKSMLNSKSKDELLAIYAKWEPWHGKFGFWYPWEKYLKIGEALREMAAIILALGGSIEISTSPKAFTSVNQTIQLKLCEAIGSDVVWVLRELGDSMKQMRKCEADTHISEKLKAAKTELSLVISMFNISAHENIDALAVASFIFLLKEVVDKVEELTKEVDQVGDIAHFRTY
ncbi:hypothetical protein TanjilG_11474 [Lupinus angustifolius]|uniref:Aluminum-activated malate transporter n=1 Tax=Lupinus angustifolius TaxID=3871 RepID=A0A1J7HY71_LUPAN|nr:PREDICTED: aluminum-activated malate transporter 14-like [Lupinus angustifolius]OIW06749.1 hypothetical protein TanjilG_11474 [Lupinus angustifolius]